MKRFILLMLICLLFISILGAGMVYAISTGSSDSDNEIKKKVGGVVTAGKEIKEEVKSRIENGEEKIKKMKEFKEKIRENNGWFEIEGKSIRVREMNEEKKEIIAGKINAKTGLNLTTEDIDDGTAGQILRAYLSNGRYAKIKIMPDRAAATALKKLEAKCLERNCTVELKEFKIGNKTIAGYEVETEKDTKLFLIFKKKIKLRAVIDAETGEIVLVKRPWWHFFAKEKNYTDKEIDDEIGDDDGNETNCYSEDYVPIYPGLECCAGQTRIDNKEEGLLGAAICTAKCGNGICDSDLESSYNCPIDCQA